MVLRGVLSHPAQQGEGGAAAAVVHDADAKKERRLLILDNLNTDLDASRTTHDDILATKVAELERFSSHLSRHYASRTT